jgi:hypothetical protein
MQRNALLCSIDSDSDSQSDSKSIEVHDIVHHNHRSPQEILFSASALFNTNLSCCTELQLYLTLLFPHLNILILSKFCSKVKVTVLLISGFLLTRKLRYFH